MLDLVKWEGFLYDYLEVLIYSKWQDIVEAIRRWNWSRIRDVIIDIIIINVVVVVVEHYKSDVSQSEKRWRTKSSSWKTKEIDKQLYKEITNRVEEVLQRLG